MPSKTTRKYINLSVDELIIGNGSFTFPTIDGLSGQTLITDGSGNLTWQTPSGGGTVTSISAGTGLDGGTITTSGTISLANTAVSPGSYTNADITVDAQGRITSASNGSTGTGTVTSITAGIGLTGGTITTTGIIDLSNTAVSAGSYTLANITVDAQGRITSATNGSISLSIGDPILGGTAGRVLYEDASNQLAESSNLSFDGNTLGVGTSSSPIWRLQTSGTNGYLPISATATTTTSLPESRAIQVANTLITGGDITGTEGLEGIRMQTRWWAGGAISGANKIATSFHSDMEMKAATTATEFVSFKSDLLVNDASSVVTNYYGLKVETPVVTTGTLTNRWGVYVTDSLASNYFAGNLGLGVIPTRDTFLDIAAATSTISQINLSSSGGIDVASPNNGDLWWNGTNLYFNNGVSDVDLLKDLSFIDTSTIDFNRVGDTVTADVIIGSLTEDYLSITGSPANGTIDEVLVSDGASGFQWRDVYELTPEYLNQQSTGLITGGALTVNGVDNTKFDVAAGSGVVIDNWTDPENPVLYKVSWGTLSSNTVTNLGTQSSTYISIDKNGNIVEDTNFPSNADRRDIIFLGKLIHPNLTTIDFTFDQPDTVLSTLSQMRDLFAGIRFINLGTSVSPNGVNLSLNLSNGTLIGKGINYSIDPKDPHTRTINPATPLTFRHRTQNGTEGSDTTTLDIANYDVAGTVTAIGGGIGSATNFRVYLFPSGQIRIYYGQTVYASLTDASDGIQSETFIVDPDAAENGILIGIISVIRTATDLSDTGEALFTSVSKFGETLGGTGGGTTATTLQQAYDNSTNPEILTDATRGALTLRRGSTADTDNILEVQNGATSTTLSINGNGVVTSGTWQGTAIADAYIASAATWNAKQDALTFGISDTNSVVIDSATVTATDYAKFTANGLEGRSFTEVKTDLSLDNVENTALSTWPGSVNITTLGTITSGTWNAGVIDEIYGGTGVSTWAAGEILYATGVDTLAALGAGSAGAYLRAGGIGVPVSWSTVSLPNSATTGDLIYASSLNNYDNLSAVAAGSILLSQGVGIAPTYGAVVDGTTIDFTVGSTLTAEVAIASLTEDYLSIVGSPATGVAGQVLASDGAGNFEWMDAGGTGTITGVTAGTALSGGGTTGTVTLDVNTDGLTILVNGSDQLYVDETALTITSTQVSDFTTAVNTEIFDALNFIDGTTIDFTVVPGTSVTAEVAIASLTEDYLAITGSPATGSNGEVLASDGAGGFTWNAPINPPDVSSYSAATVTLTNAANTYTYYAGFDTTSNSIEVTLPAASAGKVSYTMKDIGCNSETNLIRFVTAGSDTIITTITGDTSIDLVTNGGAIVLTSDGVSSWWLS